MNAIEIQSLKKTYELGQEALKGINLQIPQGSFFGLLGPNGAGKTTTIGILTGLVNKTSGNARILGYDIVNDFKHHKLYLPQLKIFCEKQFSKINIDIIDNILKR